MSRLNSPACACPCQRLEAEARLPRLARVRSRARALRSKRLSPRSECPPRGAPSSGLAAARQELRSSDPVGPRTPQRISAIRCGRARPQRRVWTALTPCRRLVRAAQGPSATPLGGAPRLALLSVYRIEILPLWAPWAPAVSRVGGGVPGMNGAVGPYAGARAMRRVTPCPTPSPVGIAASGGAAAAGAALELWATAEEGLKEVTGTTAPWAASSADSLTCAARESAAMFATRMPAASSERRYPRQAPQAMATARFVYCDL